MNAQEFHELALSLPEPRPDGQPWRAPYWAWWRHELWQRMTTEPPENFMTWPTVYHNMLANHLPVDEGEERVARDPERWNAIAFESPLPDVVSLRRNLVWQANFLLAWEESSGKRIDQLDSILEFGGGFGAMALLCRSMGFQGRYILYDFPELLLLQRWFLEAHGVEAEYRDMWFPLECDLFIALASLSESPTPFRQAILPVLFADNFIFYYPPRYEDIPNEQWFEDYAGAQEGVNWRTWKMRGLDIWARVGWRP